MKVCGVYILICTFTRFFLYVILFQTEMPLDVQKIEIEERRHVAAAQEAVR